MSSKLRFVRTRFGRVLLHVLFTNVELYDPSRGTWTPTLPLISGRAGHSAFRFASGKVVLVGGFHFDDEDKSATCEVYDPARAVALASVLTPAGKRPTEGFHFEFNNSRAWLSRSSAPRVPPLHLRVGRRLAPQQKSCRAITNSPMQTQLTRRSVSIASARLEQLDLL